MGSDGGLSASDGNLPGSDGSLLGSDGRLLGSEGTLGEMIGLDAEWAKRAIMTQGNYGEIFESNIGESTAIGLARGLNAQWTNGGLIYSPPFR